MEHSHHATVGIMTHRSVPLRRIPLIALIVASAVLVGCQSSDDSSDGPSDGVATLDSEDATPTTADDFEADLARYDECLAAEGLDTEGLDDSINEVDSEAWAAAEAACGHLLDDQQPTSGFDADQKAAFNDYALAQQQCLKDKGFDVPIGYLTGDPAAVEEEQDFFLNMSDEQFREFETADQTCAQEVPPPDELLGGGEGVGEPDAP